MSTSRSSTLLVAVVFMTAVMFTWTPDVDAGADKYWKVKKVWKYVVSSTGEMKSILIRMVAISLR